MSFIALMKRSNGEKISSSPSSQFALTLSHSWIISLKHGKLSSCQVIKIHVCSYRLSVNECDVHKLKNDNSPKQSREFNKLYHICHLLWYFCYKKLEIIHWHSVKMKLYLQLLLLIGICALCTFADPSNTENAEILDSVRGFGGNGFGFGARVRCFRTCVIDRQRSCTYTPFFSTTQRTGICTEIFPFLG